MAFYLIVIIFMHYNYATKLNNKLSVVMKFHRYTKTYLSIHVPYLKCDFKLLLSINRFVEAKGYFSQKNYEEQTQTF